MNILIFFLLLDEGTCCNTNYIHLAQRQYSYSCCKAKSYSACLKSIFLEYSETTYFYAKIIKIFTVNVLKFQKLLFHTFMPPPPPPPPPPPTIRRKVEREYRSAVLIQNFFPQKTGFDRYFMQIISIRGNLPEISKPVFFS